MQKPSYLDGIYYPAVTVAGAQGAQLRWSVDDRLSLVVATSASAEHGVLTEVFSVPVGEVLNVQLTLSQVRITLTGGTSYRFDFRKKGGYAPATVAGLIDAAVAYKESGFDDWLKEFKKSGVKTSRLGYGKLFGIAAVVAGVIIGAIVTYVLIFES